MEHLLFFEPLILEGHLSHLLILMLPLCQLLIIHITVSVQNIMDVYLMMGQFTVCNRHREILNYLTMHLMHPNRGPTHVTITHLIVTCQYTMSWFICTVSCVCVQLYMYVCTLGNASERALDGIPLYIGVEYWL